MLKVSAKHFIELGQRIAFISTNLYMTDTMVRDDPARGLDNGEREQIRTHLIKVWDVCNRLNLPISGDLISQRVDQSNGRAKIPTTQAEFDLLIDTVKTEIRKKLFLFVPQHVASYYEWDGIVSDKVIDAFPKASEEIRQGGTAFACGLNTACVFHAMRAAEIGIRAFANHLNVSLATPLELAEWQTILNAITAKIRDIENQPKDTPGRDDKLAFCSEAAAQFRFFKNGWRIRVAHARVTYNEPQAKEALDHVRSFFEALSHVLRE